MNDRINECKTQVRELEDLLNFFSKYHVPFNGHYFIIEQIKMLKIEIAEIEATERKETRRLITHN
jgi:hypothetical protein